jgi:hypothetical protein
MKVLLLFAIHQTVIRQDNSIAVWYVTAIVAFALLSVAFFFGAACAGYCTNAYHCVLNYLEYISLEALV